MDARSTSGYRPRKYLIAFAALATGVIADGAIVDWITVSDEVSLSQIIGTVISPAQAQSPPPPVANAGLDRTVVAGTLVQLDGTRSTNGSYQLLSYAWTLTDKPVGSAAALDDGAALRPTFTVDIFGDYVFELVVTETASQARPTPSSLAQRIAHRSPRPA